MDASDVKPGETLTLGDFALPADSGRFPYWRGRPAGISVERVLPFPHHSSPLNRAQHQRSAPLPKVRLRGSASSPTPDPSQHTCTATIR